MMRSPSSVIVILLTLLLVCFSHQTATSQEMCSRLRRLEADAPNNFANVKNLKLPNAAQCKVDIDGFSCEWNDIEFEKEKFLKDLETCFPHGGERITRGDPTSIMFRVSRRVEFLVTWEKREMSFVAYYIP